MKANRPFQTIRDDRAVSTVIGAILLVGIALGAIVTVRVSFVPVWEENREAGLATQVEKQVSSLKSEIDRQVRNTSATAVDNPLTLRGPRTGLFSNNPSSHSLRFDPKTSTADLAASKLLVQLSSDKSLFSGLDEDWKLIAGTEEVLNVKEVISFRLRLGAVSDKNVGDKVVLSVSEGPDLLGTFTVEIRGDPPEFDIWLTTTRFLDDGSPDVLYDQGLAFHISDSIDNYWIDVLRDDYRFNRVVNSADPPLDLDLEAQNVVAGGAGSNEDLNPEYAITYIEFTGEDGGDVIIGGGGTVVSDFARSYEGGALNYEQNNAHFLNQNWVLENGALILDQGTGPFFKTPPHFDASLSGGVVVLAVSLPSLRGEPSSLTGDPVATVSVHGSGQFQLIGQAPDVTYAVSTQYPDLWRDHIRSELEAVGLSTDLASCIDRALAPVGPLAEGCQYELSDTASGIQVTVYGANVVDADPDAPEFDLAISFTQSKIDVEVNA